jgi:uncharacterized membrane protein
MTLLPIHIIAGLIAIVAGFIAVYALKGARLHRKSGMIFVYSMWVLSLTGAVIAAVKHQPASVIGGSLAFYLVTTALLTVRRRDDAFHWTDAGALVVGVAVGVFAIRIGLDARNGVTGTSKGVPAAMLFLFATVALLGALGDVRVMLAGSLQGAHRIARHLWRMCFALFVASGSFFLGQAQVFPKPMRIYPLLAIPALLPLALLLYWLVRVLFTRWYTRRADSFKSAPLARSA